MTDLEWVRWLIGLLEDYDRKTKKTKARTIDLSKLEVVSWLDRSPPDPDPFNGGDIDDWTNLVDESW